MEILYISIFVIGIILGYTPVAEWFNKLHIKRQYKSFLSQETFYHSVVSSNIRFYNRLSLEDQRKFLFRTFLFKRAKKFHYIEVNENAEMP
ncbi:MAG: hypothetical protein EOO02_01790, partial [Chitinophagaceae bacterium]